MTRFEIQQSLSFRDGPQSRARNEGIYRRGRTDVKSSTCCEGRNGNDRRRDLAEARLQPDSLPALSRPRALRPRAGGDLPRPGMELSGPRRGNPRSRRLSCRLDRRYAGHRQPRPRRRNQGLRQPVRPSRRAGAARDGRERGRACVHLPPMVLRARRSPDGDPVPPRGARQGRARPVLRHEPTRIAAIAARTHQRRDLRHPGRRGRAA